MPKRKTAEVQDNASTDDEIVTITEQPPTDTSTTESASQPAAGVSPSPSNQGISLSLAAHGEGRNPRQPGDEPQTSWVKKASIVVDPEAGVKFHFNYERHQAIITFDEKPKPELLEVARPILSEGGFRWDKVNKDGWKKALQSGHWEHERREAKKTFFTLANAIREQKGLPSRFFGEAIGF